MRPHSFTSSPRRLLHRAHQAPPVSHLPGGDGTHPVGSTPHPGPTGDLQTGKVSRYLRLSSKVSSSEEKVPLLTLWGEWLFLPASASREIEVSFFFLLPNNFLKGWNLPPFFLSADYRINTRCGLTGLHPGASEQITAEQPWPRELGQRAAITGKGRPSPVPGMPGPALSTHSQAETSRSAVRVCLRRPGSTWDNTKGF